MAPVDEGDWSQPIEVELVSHAPSPGRRSWRRGSDEALDPSPNLEPSTSGGPRNPLSTERSRLIATAAAAGVVALVLGWVLGRAGGSDGAPVEDAAETTLSTAGASASLDTIAAADEGGEAEVAPPTTQFSPIVVAPTTVVATGTVVEDVVVDESLRGLPAEIVARASGRRVIIVDLAAGTLTTQTVEGQPFGPSSLFVGDGWALLPSWDGELDSTLLIDGEAPRLVQLGPAWALFQTNDTETFWRLDDRVRTGFSGVATEYRVDGVPTGVSLELPAYPLWADPAGGLIVSIAGGTYRVAPDGTTKITEGDLIAVGASRALVYECDESLDCRYLVADRSTGERVDLGLDPDARVRTVYADQPTTMSPDESVALAAWIDGEREAVGLVDLATGELTPVLPSIAETPMGWSPDSRVLFFLEGGQLHAHDRASGSSVRVSDELFGLETFAVRPG